MTNMELELRKSTALLIIDVQQDFCGKDGKMAQYNADLSMIDPAVNAIGELIEGAHLCGVPVIFITLQTSPEIDSHAMKSWYAKQGLDPEESVAICRKGTFGADYYRLSPLAQDYVVEKQRYSGFVGTHLELLLQGLQVKQLVATGVTTECCVDSTVRDAFMKDYEVFVVEDACAAYEQEVHDMSIRILGMNFATIMTSEQLLSSWKEGD